MRYLLLLLLTGCANLGPDYGPAERFCEKRGSQFKEGNPLYFTCSDGKQFKKASHGDYDWIDEQRFTIKEVIKINNCLIKDQIDLCGDLICESSAPLTEERVMADLGQAMQASWENPDEECLK